MLQIGDFAFDRNHAKKMKQVEDEVMLHLTASQKRKFSDMCGPYTISSVSKNVMQRRKATFIEG